MAGLLNARVGGPWRRPGPYRVLGRVFGRGASPARGQWRAMAGLAVLVAAVHLLVLWGLAGQVAALPDRPERLKADYVAELVPSAPLLARGRPVAAPPPADRLVAVKAAGTQAPEPEPGRAAAPPEPAASAPEPVASAAAGASEAVPGADPALGDRAADGSAPASSALAEAPPASAASAGASPSAPTAGSAPADVPGPDPAPEGTPPIAAGPPPFEWPPSTRLSYVLTGNYRGEVHGFAQVEWLRSGDRYQVHLEVIVGLPIAPFMVRRMSSDGRLAPEGLVPERYDEVTRIALRPERAASVTLEPAAVRLADGSWRARPRGVQDTASQFVQMAYLFALEPERLAPGRSLELPLALPRRVDTWTYDVTGEQWVETPFGGLPALHLQPRPLADARDTLWAEVWIAPTLRHLPVRLRIRQDAQTYIDLVLSRWPEIAGR